MLTCWAQRRRFRASEADFTREPAAVAPFPANFEGVSPSPRAPAAHPIAVNLTRKLDASLTIACRLLTFYDGAMSAHQPVPRHIVTNLSHIGDKACIVGRERITRHKKGNAEFTSRTSYFQLCRRRDGTRFQYRDQINRTVQRPAENPQALFRLCR